jgi:hypothetical protein
LLLVEAEGSGAMFDERVHFAEGAFVQEQVQALASGEAALIVLGFDAIRPATLLALGAELL